MNSAPPPNEAALAPARTHICVDCRTLLAPGERCDLGPAHRVVSLADAPGRRSMLGEIWGSPEVRKSARRAAQVGAGAGAASSLDWCTGCDGVADGEGFLVMIAFMLIAGVFMLIFYALRALYRAYVAHRDRQLPCGAGARAASTARPKGRDGTIVRERSTEGPLSGLPCAAWSVSLSAKSFLHGPLMLSDAGTLGFDVQLDGGAGVVRIPPGRVRLEAPTVFTRKAGDPVAEAITDPIDPLRAADPDGDLIPYDEAREARVEVGQRVRLHVELDEIPDPDSAAGDYRGPPRMLLVPRGVPAIKAL